MRAAIARRRAHDEGGFTLAELLVALMIQGLIMGALAMAFVGIMRGSTQVNQNLAKTGDARIAAQYIVSDARNSSGPEISLSDTTSCPDPSPPVAGAASPVVRFNFDSTDSDGDTVANTVNYVKVGTSLLRRQCVGGVLMSGRAVASNVQSVDVGCVPEDDCSGTPTSIVITVTSTPDASGASYSYTLSTTFRKLLGDGPPANPKSLVLLGASTTCSSTTNTVDISGGSTMRVYGDTYVNAANGASCKAMYLNGGVFSAGKTKILTGGTCAVNSGSTCPTVTSYSPAIANPYGNLTVPTTSGLTARSGCPSGNVAPGLYAGGLNITSGTCTLASGTYYIQNGLAVSNGASLTTASGGVFIYLFSGSFTIGSANSVNITAMSTGVYAGVALWQASTNTNPLTIGNGAGSFTINDGALYAPKAQLTVNGGVLPKITTVVVQNINLSNGITLTVGTASSSPLAITGPADALTTWTVNRPYDETLEGTGGDGIYVWTVTGLPSGMSVDSETGQVTGTPTSAGVYSGTVTLSDQLGDIADSASYTFTVKATPSISTSSLPNAEKTVGYSQTLSASNGATPYTWSATGLPAGLSINSSSGVISGTPTGTGTSTVNVTLTDVAGATATKSLSLTVVNGPPSITTASLATGEKTIAYSQTLAGTGGSNSYTWSATGLPSGLSMSSGGVLSGTPTTSGSFTADVTLTDSLGGSDTNAFSLTINPQPSISSVVLANKTGGVAGTIEQGDTITVQFSQAIDASTICSSWTSDTTNYTISADNNVTVTVANGTSPTPDSITVASTSCTFNFGTLNLGSSSYVAANATFKGTSTNASTITWTYSTRTLQIKLGTKTGSTTNVSSSQPIYNAANTIRDIPGAALSSSTYTLSTARQF